MSEANHPILVADWPRNADGRYICSPTRPMPTAPRALFGNARWVHLDVRDIGECSEGCCDRFECRSCGQRWLSGGDA